jgi:hypothetical protein
LLSSDRWRSKNQTIAPITVLFLAQFTALCAADARPPGTFQQGLWRGEDARVTQHNGWFYQVENGSREGPRLICQSKFMAGDVPLSKVLRQCLRTLAEQCMGVQCGPA